MTKLEELAKKHRTDKHGSAHFYAPHYERHLGHLIDRPIKLLEIGVGGYSDPSAGGESLRMWKEYFPKGLIYGLDIVNKSALDQERILTLAGDQSDERCLRHISDTHGRFDVVVDDGSHISPHVIKSFQVLFPLIAPNGIYVVEDLQTSYWPNGAFGVSWEGRDSNPHDHNSPTAIDFFKGLVDCLNYAERFGHAPTYLDLNIVAISFYHSMCFIQKGTNDEPSNLVPRYSR